MKRKIELLAPGGNINSIKAAIVAGADAIYCGLDKFNARNRAESISFDNLYGILRLAHKHNCEVFLTLNIIIVESEIPALIKLLNKLVNTTIDGVIVQDLGVFYLLSKYYKDLKIHASTQVTTHNEGQIRFLSKLNASRANLSRELNIDEIKALSLVGYESDVLTEIFVHGSYCISFSGLCYMSSVHGGNSGNRGRCSQPCRDQYLATPEGKDFPLNLKDNSAHFDLMAIADAGVGSIKIEGRIKGFDYVYTTVKSWRKQLHSFYSENRVNNNDRDLHKVFNRSFSNSFLKGEIHKDMFIDYPHDNTIKQFSMLDNNGANEGKIKEKRAYYDEKADIIRCVEEKIKLLSIEKASLTITVSGEINAPLKLSIQTPDGSFTVHSDVNLMKSGKYCLNHKILLDRLKALNGVGYLIQTIELDNLESDLYIPFKELTAIKKRIQFILNNSKEFVPNADIPLIKKQSGVKTLPTLSVLISSKSDLHLCDETKSTIYFQLPDCIEHNLREFIALFKENRALIPWFPSIIIGESYTAAVEFLKEVKPEIIVTNNTGIAYEASKSAISWVAGPYLNIANSYSLLCLKEEFNCYGSFISNELSKNQLRMIKKPAEFRLYYSLYHPILLMASRQCFFHQVTGCKKNVIDNTCIQKCNKSSNITNLKDITFYIEKEEANYNNIYNDKNYLNTDVVTDYPDLFSGFFIDLRDIKTETAVTLNKLGIIEVFESYLKGDMDAIKKLKQVIYPSVNSQYNKGI